MNRNTEERHPEKADLQKIDWYKTSVSIIFGLLGFIGSFFSLGVRFETINIYFVWSMAFPICVTLAWGKRYGLISVTFGLTFLYPFFLWSYGGWACIISSISLFLWVSLQGIGVEKRMLKNEFYYNIYFIQLIYAITSSMLFLTVGVPLYQLNHYFWSIQVLNDLSYSLAWVIAIKSAISEFILLAVCDVLLLFTSTRRLFRLDYKRAGRSNTGIILSLTFGGIMFKYLLMFSEQYIILENYVYLKQILYLDSIKRMTLMAEALFFIIVGGIVARFFQKKLEIEKNYQLLWDKMINGFFIAEPVYDRNYRLLDMKVIDFNPAMEKWSKLRKIEIVGKMRSELPEMFTNSDENLIHYEKVLETGEAVSFEYKLREEAYYWVSMFKMNKNQVGVMVSDVSEQKHAEKEILKLNTELEQRVIQRTNELQQSINELEAFACTVSHDLKAPLRAIEGYCDFIIEDYLQTLDKEVVQMINSIGNNSNAMIGLIDKLLCYSKTSKLEISKEPIDLQIITDMVFAEIMRNYPERKIELSMENKLPLIMGDKMLMKQVVANILSNAVKFTRDREIGRITAGCIISETEYIFYMKDNGVGFDMEFSGKLYGVFQRLHTDKEFEGSGIGLAIVRKIIQKHGGKTWIEGELNIGATIYFTLPINSILLEE